MDSDREIGHGKVDATYQRSFYLDRFKCIEHFAWRYNSRPHLFFKDNVILGHLGILDHLR